MSPAVHVARAVEVEAVRAEAAEEERQRGGNCLGSEPRGSRSKGGHVGEGGSNRRSKGAAHRLARTDAHSTPARRRGSRGERSRRCRRWPMGAAGHASKSEAVPLAFALPVKWQAIVSAADVTGG